MEINTINLGDIVILKYPPWIQDLRNNDFGFVYENKNNEIQILYMTSEKKDLNPVKISKDDLIDGNIGKELFVITNKIFLL